MRPTLVLCATFGPRKPQEHKPIAAVGRVANGGSRSPFGPFTLSMMHLIVGTLLGDSFLVLKSPSTAVLGFAQAWFHKGYLLYLHDLVSSHGYCNPQVPEETSTKGRMDPDTGVRAPAGARYSFQCYASRFFGMLHSQWYVYSELLGKYKKVLYRPMVEQYFGWEVLAYWISDDGTSHCGGLVLCTDSFSVEDVDFLIQLFAKVLNIQATRWATRCGPRIHIPKRYMPLLREHVAPLMVPGMLYKLGMGPKPVKKKSFLFSDARLRLPGCPAPARRRSPCSSARLQWVHPSTKSLNAVITLLVIAEL